MKHRSSFGNVVGIAMTVAYIVDSLFGIFGFLQFGDNVDGDALLNFDATKGFTFHMTLLMFINTVFSYPIGFFALRHALYGLLFGTSAADATTLASGDEPINDAIPYYPWRHRFISLIVVAMTALLAIAIPKLGTVFSLTGATSVMIVCYVYPVLVYLKLHSSSYHVIRSDHSSLLPSSHHNGSNGSDTFSVPTGLGHSNDDMSSSIILDSRRRNHSNGGNGDTHTNDDHGTSIMSNGGSHHNNGNLLSQCQRRIAYLVMFTGVALSIISLVVILPDLVHGD
jgi:hypothetical protein